MALKLFNSLGGRLEEFRPLQEGHVGLYHCGPTVKEPADISKFRSYLVADVLRRALERSGLPTTQVMNITDVGHLNAYEEDLVEIAAARSGLYAWELAEKQEQAFHEDRKALGIRDAHHYPRAREHIDAMVALIKDLEAKEVTYRSGGNLYLDITRCPSFGKLVGRSLAELDSTAAATGAAPAAAAKRHRLDIDLWRTDAMHQMAWESPWGRGFPGWHVECAAMSRKYLGGSFDIHTGAHDNLYPHHECEIAQVETLTGKPLARYWLHSAPVAVDGRPMSRQNGNLVTVRELLDSGFRGNVLRVALLGAHYRKERLDFGDALIDWARQSVDLVLGFRDHLGECSRSQAAAIRGGGQPAAWIGETEEQFRRAIDDDLDYAGALRAVLRTLERLEPHEVGDPRAALRALESWDQVLGIL